MTKSNKKKKQAKAAKEAAPSQPTESPSEAVATPGVPTSVVPSPVDTSQLKDAPDASDEKPLIVQEVGGSQKESPEELIEKLEIEEPVEKPGQQESLLEKPHLKEEVPSQVDETLESKLKAPDASDEKPLTVQQVGGSQKESPEELSKKLEIEEPVEKPGQQESLLEKPHLEEEVPSQVDETRGIELKAPDASDEKPLVVQIVGGLQKESPEELIKKPVEKPGQQESPSEQPPVKDAAGALQENSLEKLSEKTEIEEPVEKPGQQESLLEKPHLEEEVPSQVDETPVIELKAPVASDEKPLIVQEVGGSQKESPEELIEKLEIEEPVEKPGQQESLLEKPHLKEEVPSQVDETPGTDLKAPDASDKKPLIVQEIGGSQKENPEELIKNMEIEEPVEKPGHQESLLEKPPVENEAVALQKNSPEELMKKLDVEEQVENHGQQVSLSEQPLVEDEVPSQVDETPCTDLKAPDPSAEKPLNVPEDDGSQKKSPEKLIEKPIEKPGQQVSLPEQPPVEEKMSLEELLGMMNVAAPVEEPPVDDVNGEQRNDHLASEEDDNVDEVPGNDDERFFKESAQALLIRKSILAFANMRAAEHEHMANCWKLLSMEDVTDVKTLYGIFKKMEGARSLRKFEEAAFLAPYVTGQFRTEEECTSYFAYLLQFLATIPIGNYFPELGLVSGEIPEPLRGTNTTLMNKQPALMIDPKAYANRVERTKVETIVGKKKKVKIEHETIKAVPIFEESEVKYAASFMNYAENYRNTYQRIPHKDLTVQALRPGAVGPPPGIPYNLVGDEFAQALQEYRRTPNSKSSIAPSLAKKYIEKRLDQLVSDDPVLSKTYEKILNEPTPQMIDEINSINRHRSDPAKFKRLEQILMMKYCT